MRRECKFVNGLNYPTYCQVSDAVQDPDELTGGGGLYPGGTK